LAWAVSQRASDHFRADDDHESGWQRKGRPVELLIRHPLFLAIVALMLAGCVSAPESPPPRAPSAAALAAVRLDPAAATADLNAYRASRGLKPVKLDPALSAVAGRQAEAMATSGEISHDVAGAFPARLAAGGIDAARAGENLGGGYMSFAEALAGWRASAGHDANLLMTEARRFGVALAKSPSPGYGTFWAMEVAAEPNASTKAGAPLPSLSGSAARPQ
jgi:hypothetical protein